MSTSPTPVRVHHSALVMDRDYQRAVDPNRVRKIIEEFAASGLGTLTVSMRPDGRRVIIDGQHRCAAVRTIGYDGKLPCIQYTGLTLADEAAMFLLLNNAKPVAALDKFRARVIAEDTTAVAIAGLLAEHGWKVSAGTGDGSFAAVTAVEKVYGGAGVSKGEPRPDLVNIVIEVITASWGHDVRAAHNLLVGGLGQFYARYGNAVDHHKLINELSKLSPNGLIGKAKVLQDARGGTLSSALAEVVLGLHNKGRRTKRLPEWRATW